MCEARRNAYTALPIAIIAIKIEKTDEKISSRMANILSWIAAALLGAASAVVLALLVWNGFLYLEYLRQPPLARPFSHGSFAPVGDDDDWTFKPQFAENAAVSIGSSRASATRYGRIEDVHILPIVVAENDGNLHSLSSKATRPPNPRAHRGAGAAGGDLRVLQVISSSPVQLESVFQSMLANAKHLRGQVWHPVSSM
jgi:hypothetical protein